MPAMVFGFGRIGLGCIFKYFVRAPNDFKIHHISNAIVDQRRTYICTPLPYYYLTTYFEGTLSLSADGSSATSIDPKDMPTVIAENYKAKYRSGDNSFDCPAEAMISFYVSLPETSAYSVRDFGYVARVAHGEFPIKLNLKPRMGRAVGDEYSLSAWRTISSRRG